MSDSTEFTGWAIVELFGHKRLAGHVSSQVVAGGSMVRIDVPETPADSKPATQQYTKLVGVAAIYGITPVAEDVARRAAREIERWNDPLPVQLPALPAPAASNATDDLEDEEDDLSIEMPVATLDYSHDDFDDDDDADGEG